MMIWIFLFLFLILPVSAFPQTGEYTLKAVFLERFTEFTEWPDKARIHDTSEPFVISIIGTNPFGWKLEKFYSKRKIRNKKVKIRYLSEPDEIGNSHILFIGKMKHKRLTEILSYIKYTPTLTVSDTKGFAEKGVCVNFYFAKEKLRFEINETALKESGLKMSHLLLKVAKIINPLKSYLFRSVWMSAFAYNCESRHPEYKYMTEFA